MKEATNSISSWKVKRIDARSRDYKMSSPYWINSRYYEHRCDLLDGEIGANVYSKTRYVFLRKEELR